VSVSAAELSAMARARELGLGVLGTTSPNPAVGAVVLAADGTPVGEGATTPPGGPHAEVRALAQAGERARGGTAVVTLEPCAHTGRTGPCADALVAAGVARVIYAVADINPDAAGGADRLRDAGVEVVAGVEEHAAASGALRPWLHAVRSGRPFVTWKFAATLDGRSAAADYTARWISSAASRADAHRLRAVVDAIMVGSGTVLADDPHLTVREGDELAEQQPLRVVLDRRHRLQGPYGHGARVLDDAAETVVLDTAAPQFALKALHDRGVRHVLLEGGPTIAGAFLEARCVDEVVAYIAPMLLGTGPPALADAGIGTLADAATLDVESVSRLGGDLKLVARPHWAERIEE
jgi:diaminohydroxyphosphoribosylaminopyrimidine deaminase / 5-amino-6-(5-phosphoribosylamino)uracil reductase